MNLILISAHQISIQGRQPCIADFLTNEKGEKKKKEKGRDVLAFGHLLTDFFQTGYDDVRPWTMRCNCSLNDLNLHWRSQLYVRESKILCAHFLAAVLIVLGEIECAATTRWFTEVRSKFISHDQCAMERILRRGVWNTLLASDCVRRLTDYFLSNLVCWQTFLYIWYYISWNDRDLHTRSQGYRKAGNCAVCCKIAWSSQNFCDGWLCERDDYKEVL